MLTVAFCFYQAAIGPYPFTDLPWLPLANFVGLAPFFIVMFFWSSGFKGGALT